MVISKSLNIADIVIMKIYCAGTNKPVDKCFDN